MLWCEWNEVPDGGGAAWPFGDEGGAVLESGDCELF
jgi:hypothetical protein